MDSCVRFVTVLMEGRGEVDTSVTCVKWRSEWRGVRHENGVENRFSEG